MIENEEYQDYKTKCLEIFKSDLAEAVKKQSVFFKNHEKTLDDIKYFYLLDEESQKNVATISVKYLVSSFSLEYLKVLNKLIENKVLRPQVTLSYFENPDGKKEIKEMLASARSTPFIQWLNKECISNMKDKIEKVIANDIEDVLDIGNIIDLTLDELTSEREVEDIELYDVLYRFDDRFNTFNRSSLKRVEDEKISFIYTSCVENEWEKDIETNDLLMLIGTDLQFTDIETCKKDKEKRKYKAKFDEKVSRTIRVFEF